MVFDKGEGGHRIYVMENGLDCLGDREGHDGH